jgi:transcriptional regulator with XRE-family HTH domain
MDASKSNPTAGKRLKELRLRLGLSTRDVETGSRRIARDRESEEYYISHSWVTDIEKGKFRPRLFKLDTLGKIYGCGINEILSYFGMSITDSPRDPASVAIPKTHLLSSGPAAEAAKVTLPVEFKSEFQLERTNLLARVVEKWDEVPIGLLQHLDLRKSTYGYIGLEDYTLHPLIRPGSLVQIDSSQRKISAEKWKTEFDRPIYFVELRDGYVCSWCQVDHGQLIIIPHPQSPQNIRRFEFPSEAEIVGRVTGVTMRIVGERASEGGQRSPGGSR